MNCSNLLIQNHTNKNIEISWVLFQMGTPVALKINTSASFPPTPTPTVTSLSDVCHLQMNRLNSEKDRRLIKPREDRQRNICFQAEDKRNHVAFRSLKTDRRALKPFAEFPLRARFPHHCSDPLRAQQPWYARTSLHWPVFLGGSEEGSNQKLPETSSYVGWPSPSLPSCPIFLPCSSLMVCQRGFSY